MTDTQSMNLMQLFEDFDTDSECRSFLEAIRWPDGIKCPSCLGAIQRSGEVRLGVEKRKKAGKQILHAFVEETVHPKAKRLMTDENPGYLGIADSDTTHETVNHHAEEWVRGDVHTNSIEGVWS